MPALDAKLFSTVPEKDFLSLFREGAKDPNCEGVVDFLKLRKDEVAKATGIRLSTIRYDDRIPPELRNRLREWATLLNLVAGYFKGDAEKTYLWFTMSNPLLGNLSPRDMIRFGRFTKLLRFVFDSLDDR